MIGVGGMAKAVPALAGGYSFIGNGGFESRFKGTKWVQSDRRLEWRWDNEAVIVDLDGSFANQPFCAGCSLLNNVFVRNHHAFPDCYRDARYDGVICKSNYRIVHVAFEPDDPMMLFPSVQVSHRDESGIWVRESDAPYLRKMWRPLGSFNLVEMDVSTNKLSPRVVGHYDRAWQAGWLHADGVWTDNHRMQVHFIFINYLTGLKESRTLTGQVSKDGTTLTWVNGTSYHPATGGSVQIMSHVPWYRCELVPHKCAHETVRYSGSGAYSQVPISRYTPGMILPHQISSDSKYHMLLVANRRYHVDVTVRGQLVHLETTSISLGNSLRPGEWIEFETNPYPAYLATHVAPGIRPRGAVPKRVSLSGMPLKVSTIVEAAGMILNVQVLKNLNGDSQIEELQKDADGNKIIPDLLFESHDNTNMIPNATGVVCMRTWRSNPRLPEIA